MRQPAKVILSRTSDLNASRAFYPAPTHITPRECLLTTADDEMTLLIIHQNASGSFPNHRSHKIATLSRGRDLVHFEQHSLDET